MKVNPTQEESRKVVGVQRDPHPRRKQKSSWCSRPTTPKKKRAEKKLVFEVNQTQAQGSRLGVGVDGEPHPKRKK